MTIGLRDWLSELLLDVFAYSMHITEILISRQITTHDPAAMNPSSKPERELNNSDGTLSDLFGVQDDDLGEQLVSPVRYRDQVPVGLGG